MPLKFSKKFQPLKPWFDAHRRIAWKPLVKRGAGKPTSSRFGGIPWLAEDEKWPTCGRCGGFMRFFMQLDLDRLPKSLRGQFGTGLLQVFFCLADNCINGQSGADPFSRCRLLRVVKPKGSGATVIPPLFHDDYYSGGDEPDPKPFPARQITGWKQFDDYPALAEMEELGLKFGDGTDLVTCDRPRFKLATTIEEYCRLQHCAQGEKLAGWPGWANVTVDYPRCPRCKKRMDKVLFQIGSDDNIPYMFGDDGQGHIVQCPNHRDVLAFPWTCG
jgi:uncharacterized protein YwqG